MPAQGIDLGSGTLAQLARVGVRYIVEHWEEGALYRALALPLPPQSIQIQTPSAAQVTYTLGDVPIRELGRFRRQMIRIEGSSGYEARIAANREGALIFSDGPTILAEFEAFLREYQKSAEEGPQRIVNGTLGQSRYLIFRALDEGINAQVEIESLEIQRSAAGENFSRGWVLSFFAYDDADPTPRPFEDFQSAIDGINDAIDLAAAGVAVAAVAVQGSAALARMTLAPLQRLSRLAGALGEVQEGIRSLLDLPGDMLKALAQAGAQLATVTARAERDIEGFRASINVPARSIAQLLGAANEIELGAEAAVGLGGRSIGEEETSPAPPIIGAEQFAQGSGAESEAVFVYRLKAGDDLYSLARRVLGDITRWEEIRALNGWQSATRTARGAPPRSGDLVLIPRALNRGETVRESLDQFGVDLHTRAGSGDLSWGAGDLELVGGPQNLEQALRLRLATRAGESAILGDYGLPLLIGQRTSSEMLGYISAHVRAQVLADERISDILRLDLTEQGDQISVDLEARAEGSGLLIVNAPIEGA